MNDKLSIPALDAIIKDVKEHVSFLQELAITGLDRAESKPRIATPEHLMTRKETEPMKPLLSGPLLFDAGASKELARSIASDESIDDVWKETCDCTRCPLWEERTNVVNSEGNRHARLMFVGEAPGADEDAQARPFVGRAGQLLNKIIESIGLKREDVFIGNVNRCRPPQNRAPTPSEAGTCKPFILREIDIVRPLVIVVLGNVAMKNLLNTKEGITKLRESFRNTEE